MFLYAIRDAIVVSALCDDRRTIWREASIVSDLQADIVVVRALVVLCCYASLYYILLDMYLCIYLSICCLFSFGLNY